MVLCVVLPLQARGAEAGVPQGSERAGLLEVVPSSAQLPAEGHRLPAPAPEHWPPVPPSVRSALSLAPPPQRFYVAGRG